MKKQLILFLLSTFLYQPSFSQILLTEKFDLMPWPKSIEEHSTNYLINSTFTISINGDDSKRVNAASTNFIRRLSNRTGVFLDHGFPMSNKPASVEIKYNSFSNLSLHEDESYILDVNNKRITISSATDVGALRALETLLQLVNFDSTGYYFRGVHIEDSPRFVWRGLMIDAARHFQPVNVIKRNLDAMASVKLNVFHWHLTDDQGFRIESKVYPKLHELGSDGLYYSQEQIKEIVNYASDLGIRVVPEIDVPGHASAILTAYPELGSKPGYHYSIEHYAGVFNPTLDPTNDQTYVFLENLIAEIAQLFPDEYFHIGGDENEGKHWSENDLIQQFMQAHHLKTNHDLQTYFNIKLEKILNRNGKNLMGWDEIMTPNMPTTAIIHSWRGENEGLPKGGSLISAAKKGYQTVLSNGYYIDRMLSVKNHYNVDPIGDVQLTEEERARILGGEATMWSELVTPLTIDSRIWPRTAAIAERFWSSKDVKDVENMLKRLKVINNHLEELGITHKKNKDVILRNLTNHQDIQALITLSNICEPLKMYTRNKGGTEYKSFSPFTLFADACTVDAEDGLIFKSAVNLFIDAPNEKNKHHLLSFFDNWISGYEGFKELQSNPILNNLDTTYTNLYQISKLYKTVLLNNSINNENLQEIDKILEQLKLPFVDVELVIVDDLIKISDFFENQ